MAKKEIARREKSEVLAAGFKAAFPGVFSKHGEEWGKDCVIWTGGDGFTPGGNLAFDYGMDNEEYILGVQKDVRAWLDAHGLFAEHYDSETVLVYFA